MKKIYIKEISCCTECPSCTTDNNLTRFLCNDQGGQFIGWTGDDVFEIPKWCKLIDSDKFSESDFTL